MRHGPKWLGLRRALVAALLAAYSALVPCCGGNSGSSGGGAGTPPPANQAPVVDAGPDQSATLAGGATLTGTVAADGLPSGSVTSAWSQVSGP